MATSALVTVSSQIANWLALLMSASADWSCGKEFAEVAEPWTGLSQPMSAVSFAAFSWVVMNLRTSTASAAFLLWALTRNPSGAPGQRSGVAGGAWGAGSRMKSQLSASSARRHPPWR